MFTKKQILDSIDELNIEYDITQHNAVFTMEESREIFGKDIVNIPKNIFVRDGRGKHHFLISTSYDNRVDLKTLGRQLNMPHLGFASDDRLMKYLGLSRGAVTPLGIYNDINHEVVLLIDSKLQDKPRLGFHLCDNTTTMWISFADLLKIINNCNNQFKIIN